MATQEPVPGELLCVDELERKLTDLSEQVELKKEEVRSNFQQLHDLLSVRESFLLKEMDDIVALTRHEVEEKKGTLQELYNARNSLEKDLTKNKLKKVLEKHLLELEAEIGEEVARDVHIGYIELEWKSEKLEQSIIEVCKVIKLKEKPVTRVGYSRKLGPVWSHDGTISGRILYSRQIAIDEKTQNIFVVDFTANMIQVFNEEGNHVYEILRSSDPIGIAISGEYIFLSTWHKRILKIDKTNNEFVKSVGTDNEIYGIETNTNSDIYLCEHTNGSILVYNSDLLFLRRIKLNSLQLNQSVLTCSLKLHEDHMYVMFGYLYPSPPPFVLQVFTLEGDLVRSLLKKRDIGHSYFFSIDQLGNIIVADWESNQIKIFSKEGKVIHTITSDMLPGDHKFDRLIGVALDKQNRIIVAHDIRKYNLLAF